MIVEIILLFHLQTDDVLTHEASSDCDEVTGGHYLIQLLDYTLVYNN